jgi:hypothetical protein
MRTLDIARFTELLQTVFAPGPAEKDLLLLVDLPTSARPDTQHWRDRRRLVAEWYTMLQPHAGRLPFAGVSCAAYDHVATNNADLPAGMMLVDRCTPERPSTVNHAIQRDDLLGRASVVLALTELSATAPLKNLARQLGFRGASMPGFTRAMLPALQLDYAKIDARVRQIKERLDRADAAEAVFLAGGERHLLHLDLRFRTGHASGGLMREQGTVANLPSGEAYIVPYEGEKEGIPSKTEGSLPIEMEGEVLVFKIKQNKAVDVMTSGRISDSQRSRLVAEPAYGNLSELGIGVLGDFGVTAMGQTLVDEKLGLHIAFGRSDHFGGATSPGSFRNAKNVVHIDWVYVPSVQPRIRVESLSLRYPDRQDELVIQNDKILI